VEFFSVRDDLPSVKHVMNLQRPLAGEQENSFERFFIIIFVELEVNA
jgi:hypothetical protein